MKIYYDIEKNDMKKGTLYEFQTPQARDIYYAYISHAKYYDITVVVETANEKIEKSNFENFKTVKAKMDINEGLGGEMNYRCYNFFYQVPLNIGMLVNSLPIADRPFSERIRIRELTGDGFKFFQVYCNSPSLKSFKFGEIIAQGGCPERFSDIHYDLLENYALSRINF